MLCLLKYGYDRKEAFRISEQVKFRLSDDDCESMRQHGVPEWYIDSCRKIQYAFPRAHAAVYVLLAYRIAYYKAHDPLAFYCAYFSIYASELKQELLTISRSALKEKIVEYEKVNHRAWFWLELLWLCDEMFEAGYEFDVEDVTAHQGFSGFIIKNGKIRPVEGK